MHYDPPPPLTLTDLDGMRRRGEFRFANRLRAYIDVEDGRITGCGYTGDKSHGAHADHRWDRLRGHAAHQGQP